MSRAPTKYNGGKIYYAKGKNRFRVYPRIGDLVEKVVNGLDWSKTRLMKKKWLEALAFIDNDPRPRDP